MYLVKDGDVEGMRMGLEIDIFTTEETRADAGREKVMEILLTELFPFKKLTE